MMLLLHSASLGGLAERSVHSCSVHSYAGELQSPELK